MQPLRPDLTIQYRTTAELVPYARNSRTHSETQVSQIAASIKEFGFTNPVLLDEGDVIIAGHGRVLAAQVLKLDRVPCIVLAGLSEAQKRAYVIADNKLAMNAGWDTEMLAVELAGLKELGYDAEKAGFSASELEHILSGWEPSDEPESTDPSDDALKAVLKVRCNSLDEDDVRKTVRRALAESGIAGVELVE